MLVGSSPITVTGVRAFLAGEARDFLLPRHVQFVTRLPEVREMAGDVIGLRA